MRSLLRIRRSRPLPEVEAQIALLAEELPLTAMFVKAMQREGRMHAAVGVIDEQRTSLRNAQSRMLHAFAARRRRIQAAMAGALAAVMLASGSYAAVHILAPHAPAKTELIRRATVKLDEAQRAETPAQFVAIAAEMQKSLLAIPQSEFSDPQTRNDVAGILGKAQALFASAPNAAELLKKVQEVANQVDVAPQAPKPAPKPRASSQPAPSVAPPQPEP